MSAVVHIHTRTCTQCTSTLITEAQCSRRTDLNDLGQNLPKSQSEGICLPLQQTVALLRTLQPQLRLLKGPCQDKQSEEGGGEKERKGVTSSLTWLDVHVLYSL